VFGVRRAARKNVRRPHAALERMMFSHDCENWKEICREVLGDDAVNWTMKTELHTAWTGADYAHGEDNPWFQWGLWRDKSSTYMMFPFRLFQIMHRRGRLLIELWH